MGYLISILSWIAATKGNNRSFDTKSSIITLHHNARPADRVGFHEVDTYMYVKRNMFRDFKGARTYPVG